MFDADGPALRMTNWQHFVATFFNAAVMAKYLPDIVDGFILTVGLAILVVISGIAAGLLLAVLRSFGVRPLNWLLIFVVDLFRALPPLVVIVLIYFGLPSLGFEPSAFGTTWASLSLVLMSFAEEIFWAGITAVPKASGKPRAPPACRSCKRSVRWCCRRRSA